ncbi:helix-turn-helix transcriptional regulator [Nocardia vulneris]|uniref:helix-turn-helix domain-containing protein n=1 Tax=Nocardia vulneris TaxID=1141657 RepID=UPI0030CFBB94
MANPNTITTRQELAAAIAELLDHGTRSYQAVAADAELGVATVYDMANGKSFPRWGSLQRLLSACGITGTDLAAWRGAHQRAQTDIAKNLPGSTPEHTVTDSPAPPAINPVAARLRRWRSGQTSWAAGALSLVAVVVAAIVFSPHDKPTSPPLTAAVKTVVRGNCAALILPTSADQLGAPPPHNGYGAWVNTHDAALNGSNLVQVSITGTGPEPVIITGLHAEIIDRVTGPLKGIRVNGQCGSPIKARYADFDLDTTPPKIVGSNADPAQYLAEDQFSTSPLTFPYKISNTDPELLLIAAKSPRKDTVSYRLYLDWTNGKTNGTITLDDNGKPFKVATAEPDSPLYVASGATFSPIK